MVAQSLVSIHGEERFMIHFNFTSFEISIILFVWKLYVFYGWVFYQILLDRK